LTHVVPFPVEDELKRTGGIYEKAAGKALLELLAVRKAA
jgi:hypothetical protein